MITPMIAAYFLKAKGHASHGEGRAMDVYMKILNWTLMTERAREIRAKLGHLPTTAWNFLTEAAFVLLIIGAAVLGARVTSRLITPLELWASVRMVLVVAGALASGWVAATVLGRLIRIAFRDGSIAAYHVHFIERLRARQQDHRLWMFGIGIGALGLTLALLMLLPQQFQPLTDSDSSRANIQMVPGTTLEQTEAVADRVANLLRTQKEDVRRVMERVNEGDAVLFVMLREDRAHTSIDFERRMTQEFQKIPDARVTFSSQSGGGGTGRDISIMLAGSDPVLLNSTARTLVEQMKGVPGAVAPRVDADLQRPELVITPRLDLAAQLGVTTSALSQAIRIATIGEFDQAAAKFSLSDRQIPIRVMLPKASRRDFSTIENLPVPTTSGGSVPLKRVAEIRFGAGPTQIQRYNPSRRIFVGADLAEGQLKGPVMEQIDALPVMKNLPTGVTRDAVGDEKWQQELITNFIIAVISGVMMVFGVLVLLYRRFVSPLVNMTSLLLAPLGGLLALVIIGLLRNGQPDPISIAVYIGLLMLLGIVAKNSILLIDFAIEEMERGTPKRQAILEAGHKRAQPIVMTTVAMVAGMVPTALSLSGDAAWRAPMGITVIGGLLLSTLLTLLIVPAGFSLADSFEKRIGPWLRKSLLTYRPEDEHPKAEGYPAE
jgi:multidrug efflux pump subunit AcrB